MNLYKILVTHNRNKVWHMKDDSLLLHPEEAKFRVKHGLLEKIDLAEGVVIIDEVDPKPKKKK